MSQAEVGIN